MFGNNRSFTKHARRVQKLFSPRLCFVLLICPVQAGHSFDPSILGLCLVLTSLCHDVVGPDSQVTISISIQSLSIARSAGRSTGTSCTSEEQMVLVASTSIPSRPLAEFQGPQNAYLCILLP